MHGDASIGNGIPSRFANTGNSWPAEQPRQRWELPIEPGQKEPEEGCSRSSATAARAVREPNRLGAVVSCARALSYIARTTTVDARSNASTRDRKSSRVHQVGDCNRVVLGRLREAGSAAWRGIVLGRLRDAGWLIARRASHATVA